MIGSIFEIVNFLEISITQYNDKSVCILYVRSEFIGIVSMLCILQPRNVIRIERKKIYFFSIFHSVIEVEHIVSTLYNILKFRLKESHAVLTSKRILW